MNIIAKWELIEQGLQWRNIGTPPPVTSSGIRPNNAFSLGHVVIMFFVDMSVYQFAAWYIEKVFPGEYGLPQPFYFLLKPSYWRGLRLAGTSGSALASTGADQADNKKLERHEPPPPRGAQGGGADPAAREDPRRRQEGAEGHQLGHARGRHPAIQYTCPCS